MSWYVLRNIYHSIYVAPQVPFDKHEHHADDNHNGHGGPGGRGSGVLGLNILRAHGLAF